MKIIYDLQLFILCTSGLSQTFNQIEIDFDDNYVSSNFKIQII